MNVATADRQNGEQMKSGPDIALSFDGVPITYEVGGSGAPALVFVHGWCCDRHYWDEQVDHFAAHYAVVTIDLGGHGASGRQRTAWTMSAFGRDVVAVVERLGLPQAVLIGHSMGGFIIQNFWRITPPQPPYYCLRRHRPGFCQQPSGSPDDIRWSLRKPT